MGRSLRSRQYQVLAIALPVGLFTISLLAGLTGPAGRAADGTIRNDSILAALATLGALGAGLAASGSRLAAERDSGWVRMLIVVSLPRFHMLVGRVITGIVTAGMSIIVVIGIGVLVRGGGFAPASWLQLIASLWIGTLPFALLGLVVGLSLGRRAAFGAVLVLYFGLAVAGGLLEPIGSLPLVLATIGRVLPSFLVDDLGWHALLGQGLNAYDLTLLAAESLALGSLIAWNRRNA